MIERSGHLARDGVLHEDLNKLAEGVMCYYQAQLQEGMQPLPEIDGAIAKKYSGGGYGGYALYLFSTQEMRDSAVQENQALREVEPV